METSVTKAGTQNCQQISVGLRLEKACGGECGVKRLLFLELFIYNDIQYID
jgi:hypothetical protein